WADPVTVESELEKVGDSDQEGGDSNPVQPVRADAGFEVGVGVRYPRLRSSSPRRSERGWRLWRRWGRSTFSSFTRRAFRARMGERGRPRLFCQRRSGRRFLLWHGSLRLHRELLLDAVDARRQLGKQVPDCLEVILGLVHTGRGSWTGDYPPIGSGLHAVFVRWSY